VTVEQVMTGNYDHKLIRLDAYLLDRTRRSTQQSLILQAGQLVVNAPLEELMPQEEFAALQTGSLVRVTGVCSVQKTDPSRLPQKPQSFQMFLRRPSDITVLQRPPWWSIKHTLGLMAAMSIIFLIAAGWIAILRKRVEKSQAVLAERTRMARELHDTLEQGLVGIRFQLEAVTKRAAALPNSFHIQEHLNLARKLVGHCQEEAHRSVWDLRAQALESGDLISALTLIAEELSYDPATSIEVKTKGVARRLPSVVETNVLRIGQEAMTNALKHAGACHITVEVCFEKRALLLSVKDDGRGFGTQTPF
jgi:signal transduction histidine kinase